MAAVVVSKPATATTASTSAATAAASATTLPIAARVSDKNRMATPVTMGSQTIRLRIGQVIAFILSPLQQHECKHERNQPDNHGKRIVVQETGLDRPQARRKCANQLRRSMNDPAVDQRPVTALGKEARKLEAATSHHPLVELIETVLAIKNGPERMQTLLECYCNRWLEKINPGGKRNAQHRQPENRRHEAVQRECSWPVEMLADMGQRVTGRRHVDCI